MYDPSLGRKELDTWGRCFRLLPRHCRGLDNCQCYGIAAVSYTSNVPQSDIGSQAGHPFLLAHVVCLWSQTLKGGAKPFASMDESQTFSRRKPRPFQALALRVQVPKYRAMRLPHTILAVLGCLQGLQHFWAPTVFIILRSKVELLGGVQKSAKQM